MANAPRSQKIQPGIEPIKGSVGAPPVPGTRQIVEQPGEGDDGRRSDSSAHHQGQAVASQIGGAAVKRPYPRARY